LRPILSDSLPFSTFAKATYSLLFILFPILGGFRQDWKKYFQYFLIHQFSNWPIYQLKYMFQVASLQKEKTGSINRTPTFPLTFIFSLDGKK